MTQSSFDFDLFVIGGGSGGVRAARIAAQHGARVGIAEGFRYGGTCVIRGCVPKKLLVYASRFPQSFEESRGFGWNVSPATFDWEKLVAAKNAEITRLEGAYSANLDKAGVKRFGGYARFLGPNRLAIDTQDGRQEVTAKEVLIATGGEPVMPEELPGGPSLDDLAVLIHTGGTTGVPKAVALTHRNLASNAAQTLAWVPIVKRGAEVEAGVLPFFHAFGLTTVLVLGVSIAATIVLLPRFDVAALLAAHRRRPITLVPGVPPMFERILEAAESHAKPVDLTSICFAFSGAMALEEAVASRWEEATGGYIIEGYGMTEASPIIAGSPLSPERRPSTLGLPLPSTEIRLADPEDPSRDAEDVGEILVRGPQVFSGYYGMPEETAEVLADGWLRTGDLGRWDEGFLVMADRRKELIINGGFNVYPSQVEEAIMGMPGVRDVAVVGMPEDRGESVVAALVLEPGAIVDLDAVRRWTQDKLSHYAMPRSIAVMDELPRSQLGKVMRRSVREQLAGFELLAGQWRRKASELGETTSENLKSVIGKSTSAVSGAVRSSSDAVRHGAEVVTGAARHGAEVVSEAARQGAGAVSEAARNATEAIAGAARNAGGAIQGRLTSTGESLVSAMKRGERTPSAGDGRTEGPPALPEAPGEPDAPDVSTDRDAAEGEDADGSVRDGRPPGSPRP